MPMPRARPLLPASPLKGNSGAVLAGSPNKASKTSWGAGQDEDYSEFL